MMGGIPLRVARRNSQHYAGETDIVLASCPTSLRGGGNGKKAEDWKQKSAGDLGPRAYQN